MSWTCFACHAKMRGGAKVVGLALCNLNAHAGATGKHANAQLVVKYLCQSCLSSKEAESG